MQTEAVKHLDQDQSTKKMEAIGYKLLAIANEACQTDSTKNHKKPMISLICNLALKVLYEQGHLVCFNKLTE